ncbi:MAG: hypothetical protein FD167_961 [bacterium]|nr:MAG: hypothetical protein FD167_961 [bacterium]
MFDLYYKLHITRILFTQLIGVNIKKLLTPKKFPEVFAAFYLLPQVISLLGV